jgi:hypothetical protein
MPDIRVVLACLSPCAQPTTLGQLGARDRGDARHQRPREHQRTLALEQ